MSAAPVTRTSRFFRAVRVLVIWWLVLAFAALCLAVPAFAIDVASPDATRLAIAGWSCFIVPMGVLVIDRIVGDAGRTLTKALALAAASVLAWLFVGALVLQFWGPHEGLFFTLFGFVVVTGYAIAARMVASLDWVHRLLPILAISLLTLAGGYVSIRVFRNELAWNLPWTATHVRQVSFANAMGIDDQYVRATLDEEEFRDFVRRLGLTPGLEASPRIPTTTVEHLAPSWYRPRGQLWIVPREAGGVGGCRTLVWRQRTTVHAAHLCAF